MIKQESFLNTINVVLFDFDGILVDTEWVIYQSWLRFYKKHEQELPLDIYTQCIGSDFDTWSPKTHLENLTGKFFLWEKEDKKRQYEIESELVHEGLMSGMAELLDALRSSGKRMSVVSSSSHRWVEGWINRLGVRDYFEEVICKGDAPRIKPAPDLYLEAMHRMKVNADDCLVIEDSANGVKAAKEAGAFVVAVPNHVTCGLDFSQANVVCNSMEEVRNFFETQKIYSNIIES
jgi:HAD superfamily hydrolase (TIGR01509 family)